MLWYLFLNRCFVYYFDYEIFSGFWINFGLYSLRLSFPCLFKVFNWTYFTNKIMTAVNLSIEDSEQVILYAPNYLKRLNPVLAKYTKRWVTQTLSFKNQVPRKGLTSLKSQHY